MDAVTYPDPQVASFIQEYFIPFRVQVSEMAMHEKYHTFWTPTLAIFGFKGMNVQGRHEVQRTIGFLAPEDLLPMLHLGIAKVRLDQDEHETALRHLDRLLAEYPASDSVPEAIYFRGVTLYKQLHDAAKLREALEELQRDHPRSAWTKRAQPYRAL